MKTQAVILFLLCSSFCVSAQSPDGVAERENKRKKGEELVKALGRAAFDADAERAYSQAETLDSIAHALNDAYLIAGAKLHLAEGMRRQWQIFEALQHAEEAAAYFKQAGLNDEYLLAAEIVAFCIIVSENAAAYYGFLTEAAKTAKEVGNDYQEANLLTALASANTDMARFEVAMEYHNEALSIRKAMGDTVKWGGSLVNLAGIYQMIDEPEFSITLLEEALELFDAVGEEGYRIRALNNLVIAYAMLDKLDEQVHLMEEVIKANIKDGNYIAAASSISVIGLALQRRKEFARSEEEFRRSIELAEQKIDPFHETLINARLGLIGSLEAQGKYDEAAREFEKIRDIPEENYRIELLGFFYQAASEYYRHRRDLERALNYFEQSVMIKDSLRSADNSKAMMQQQVRYTFEKKEALLIAEQEKKDALASEQLRRKNLQRNASLGGFGLMLLLAMVFFTQRRRIAKEKERSEHLLLNILPAETAEELMATGSSKARHIDQVTVLFTDFKGFTALSEQLPPEELVAMINECFSAFDRITEKYGIEKIKTIGDAYMAAGGLPSPNQTHATDVVRAALDIQRFMTGFKSHRQAENLPAFEIRIGIHTGPVVAGIVGIKKFQYDIWGDTVNTAARMESSGEVGQVNISEATYAQVHDRFECTFRGAIEAKGKGKLGMYFVLR